MMELSERIQTITKKYVALFGQEPSTWVRAPGRVELLGSHTDYNQGYVMTMTIDRDTWIAARPRQDHTVRVHSLNIEGGAEFDLEQIDHDERYSWTDYIRGVAWAIQQAGYQLVGFDGLVHSTIPFGSGLSSSAALEMAVATLLAALANLSIPPVEMALLGQKAENRFVGVSTGILDQYSSRLGQAGCALLLDCRALTSQNVSISPDIQVVICDTNAERKLVGSEYDTRRSQCEQGVRLLGQWLPGISALRDLSLEQFKQHENKLPDVVARRCRFVIEENQRVLAIAEALPGGERQRLAQIMSDSWIGARDLYEISAPSMEAMMEAIAEAPGLIAGRQTGAGFGGCMVALVEAGKVPDFSERVAAGYHQKSGRPGRIYPVRAVDGAGVLRLP
jgi:galactokinase